MGYCQEGREFHISYHQDGNMFRTIDGKPERMVQFQSFANFKDAQQIGAFAFTTDLNRFRDFSNYELKEVDAAVYLDMRALRKQHDFVNCLVELLEPQRFDLLKVFTSFPTRLKEIQMFTDYHPWIVVVISGLERDPTKVDNDKKQGEPTKT
jgi:hypothetical protein